MPCIPSSPQHATDGLYSKVDTVGVSKWPKLQRTMDKLSKPASMSGESCNRLGEAKLETGNSSWETGQHAESNGAIRFSRSPGEGRLFGPWHGGAMKFHAKHLVVSASLTMTKWSSPSKDAWSRRFMKPQAASLVNLLNTLSRIQIWATPQLHCNFIDARNKGIHLI